jgi:ribose transport system permease protein
VTSQGATFPSFRLFRRRSDWREWIIYLGFIALFAFFSVTLRDSGFLTANNLLNVFRQTATISVMAVAMTFVIAAAEIDLSIGSVAGLASVVAAMTMPTYGLAGAALGLGSGLIVGIVNGGFVAGLGVPSFLVTLGMLGFIQGFSRFISGSYPIAITDERFIGLFGGGELGPVPGLLFWTLGTVAIGIFVMNHTVIGRRVRATGGNPTAARYTGVNTVRVKFGVLVASSLLASLAGLLYAGRLHSGRFQWGTGDELSVIAAVILGGTSLFGGRGAVVGSLFGALLIGLANNGLVLAGLDVSQQQMVRGLIIIAAVALSRKR